MNPPSNSRSKTNNSSEEMPLLKTTSMNYLELNKSIRLKITIRFLKLMYKNVGQGNALGLGNVANFNGSIYWSSTEINWEYACGMDFAMNAQASNHKITTGHVRAIRSF